MSDVLVIRLGNNFGGTTQTHVDADEVQYLLVDPAGGRLGAVLTGPLSQAAVLAVTRRVIVLAPATEVVCAEPELPAKNATRLAQLAPFALEEQLATDIDAMHFAVGKRGPNGQTPVGAVRREQFESWLAMLSATGIEPDVVCAESSVIPVTNGGATLIVDRGLLYVRHAHAPGLVLDVQPLREAFHLALVGEAGAHVLGDLQLYATQPDYEQFQSEFDALRNTFPGLQIKLLPEGPLPLFAPQAMNDSTLNFLCGKYQRKSSFATSFAPWRYAAVLLGIAALLHFGYGGINLWRSTRAERDVDQEIRQLTQQTLAGVTLNDTRDARKQFESRLAMAKQGGVHRGLLSSLATLGDALSQAPQSRIEALSYRTQTVDLRITAPNVDALDKIQQAASAAGLNAQIQSATPHDNKVEGRLQLKSGA